MIKKITTVYIFCFFICLLNISNSFEIPKFSNQKWISINGKNYSVGLHIDNNNLKYAILDQQGNFPLNLSMHELNKLAWAYEASNAVYLKENNTRDLELLRDSMKQVRQLHHTIDYFEKVQEELIKIGVVVTSAQLTGGTVVLKKMSNIAKDALIDMIVKTPAIAARGTALVVLNTNINRLNKLIDWIQEKSTKNKGLSSSNSYTFEEIVEYYNFAVLIDSYLVPSAQLLIDTQSDASLVGQTKRLIGVAVKETIDANTVGQLHRVVQGAIYSYDAISAITAAYPDFKDYIDETKKREQKWKNSRTSINDYRQSKTYLTAEFYKHFRSKPKATEVAEANDNSLSTTSQRIKIDTKSGCSTEFKLEHHKNGNIYKKYCINEDNKLSGPYEQYFRNGNPHYKYNYRLVQQANGNWIHHKDCL